MKLKYIISAVFASVVLFAGCAKEEATETLKNILVSKTYVAINPAGSTETITVESSVDWAFSSDIPSWIKITPTSGSACEKVTVSIEAGECDFGRQAELQIKAGVHTQFLTVRQGEMTAETVTCKESMEGTAGKTYRVRGMVASIASTTYGNMYLDDGSGVQAYIYGTLDAEGAEKNFSSLGIEVGDVVTVEGPLTFYNSTAELVNVTVLKIEKSLLKIFNEKGEEAGAQFFTADGGEFVVRAAYKGSGAFVSVDKDFVSMVSMDYVQGIPSKLEKSPADTAIIKFRVAENVSEDARNATVTISSSKDKDVTALMVGVSQLGLAGTEANPFTVAQAIEFCKPLTAATTENYYVKGKVSRIKDAYASKYGNAVFWISDDGECSVSEDGKSTSDKDHDFEAYQVYWFDGEKWVDGNSGICVGDEVVICGQLTCYNGTCETNSKNAWIYSVNGIKADNGGLGSIDYPLSIKAACAFCSELTAETELNYYVTGTVCELTKYQFSADYNTASFWLSDDGTNDGDRFEAYSIYYMNNPGHDSSVKWPADGKLIEVGQEILLYGQLTCFNGTCETNKKNAHIVSINGETE